MALKDRLRWNVRYHQKKRRPDVRPSVQRFHQLAAKGKALDLATGLGENALFLARSGFTVFAVDISDEAVLPLARRHPNLIPVCLDLDEWDIPTNFFDLIINIRFLNRRLFPQIIEGLKPGGVLIAETYLVGSSTSHTSSCRDYLLRPNELLHAFLPLRLVHYNEEISTQKGSKGPLATLVGLKPNDF